MKMLYFAVGLSLVLAACQDPLLTGPSDPPPSPPPVEHPRVDQPFSLAVYQGIIAFGLGEPSQNEEDVLAFVNTAMSHGWNTLEICSETEFWDPEGKEYPAKPRDVERLRWLLDIIARVPGAQVALIGNCTLKRQVSLSDQLNWASDVACTIAGGRVVGIRTCEPNMQEHYQNVAIFTHNEFENCRGRSDWGGNDSNCPGKRDIADHINIYKQFGIEYITADDSFSWPKHGDPDSLTYGFRLSNIGAYPASFHPDREKNGQPWDPSLYQLQQLARFNGEYILSETVAWMDYSGRCDGLRTCDQNRINNYIATCAQVPECHFTYHSENGLAGIVPTFIPEAR